MTNHSRLLGGLSIARFLARHWQKQPLLMRSAVPDAADIIDRDALLELACEDEAEARIVVRRGRDWELRHGPFHRQDFRRLPRTGWTVLVQGVNHFNRRAEALLDGFDFVPRARLDDIMVSYAAPGGGVGPHFDSYDVFLLQGAGRRHWRVSSQDDRTLDPRAPLRILSRFRAEADWILDPGDMLYLPPRYAHDGIAVGECVTLSVGFRAPSAQELAGAFLDHLRDHVELDGSYADPDLRRPAHPGAIDTAMVRQVERMLAGIRWDRGGVADFLGRYMTEPKANVIFSPPARPVGRAAFERRLAARGARLDSRSLMLFRDGTVYINGEAHPDTATPALVTLADRRQLGPDPALAERDVAWLYAAYRAGYIALQ